LGTCRSANVETSQSNDNNKIYGVLPYVTPEVLSGKEYTQEIDIYGFGIIANEICTGIPPYLNPSRILINKNISCAMLRPRSNYEIPKPILDIIDDVDPSKRPKAKELPKLLEDLIERAENSTINNKQISETNYECLSFLYSFVHRTFSSSLYK
jgi:hypothetical protein